MKKFVQLDNGVVTATLDAAAAPTVLPTGRTFVEVGDEDATPPAFGSTYNPNTQAFTPPPAPPDYGRTVTVREFLSLFTLAERKAIRNRVLLDDDVADWFSLFIETAEPIRLKHPDTITGLTFLVGKTLLTPARRTAIANG